MELKWKPISEFKENIEALVANDKNEMFSGYLFADEDFFGKVVGYLCSVPNGNFETNIKYFISIEDLIKAIPND